MSTREHQQLRDLLRLPQNARCVDCAVLDPKWASFSLGYFMCIECSGIHRMLGTHITKVKSTTLDTWKPEYVEVVRRRGNVSFNAEWEARLPAGKGIDAHTGSAERERFIRAKYERQAFRGTATHDSYARAAAKMGCAVDESGAISPAVSGSDSPTAAAAAAAPRVSPAVARRLAAKKAKEAEERNKKARAAEAAEAAKRAAESEAKAAADARRAAAEAEALAAAETDVGDLFGPAPAPASATPGGSGFAFASTTAPAPAPAAAGGFAFGAAAPAPATAPAPVHASAAPNGGGFAFASSPSPAAEASSVSGSAAGSTGGQGFSFVAGAPAPSPSPVTAHTGSASAGGFAFAGAPSLAAGGSNGSVASSMSGAPAQAPPHDPFAPSPPQAAAAPQPSPAAAAVAAVMAGSASTAHARSASALAVPRAAPAPTHDLPVMLGSSTSPAVSLPPIGTLGPLPSPSDPLAGMHTHPLGHHGMPGGQAPEFAGSTSVPSAAGVSKVGPPGSDADGGMTQEEAKSAAEKALLSAMGEIRRVKSADWEATYGELESVAEARKEQTNALEEHRAVVDSLGEAFEAAQRALAKKFEKLEADAVDGQRTRMFNLQRAAGALQRKEYEATMYDIAPRSQPAPERSAPEPEAQSNGFAFA